MLTYTKTIQKPRLEIYHDNDSDCPLEWYNMSTMVLKYLSSHCNSEIMEALMDTYDECKNSEDHLDLMTKEVERILDAKVVYSNFISKYEHSGVSFSLGITNGWDSGINGMVFVTEEDMNEYYLELEEVENRVLTEIHTLNSWVNGDVYRFKLYDSEGEEEDSCGGFYDLEDIREELPEEFQEEELQKYIKTF